MSERQSVTFSDQAMAELRIEAKQLGMTVSNLLRIIVDRWKERTLDDAALNQSRNIGKLR
jgi:hypothetical protein